MSEAEDIYNFHPDLIENRLKLSECLLFGMLKKETYDKIFLEINSTYLEADMMLHFLESKGLKAEYEQFCEHGISD